jgi:hypothetical protein
VREALRARHVVVEASEGGARSQHEEGCAAPYDAGGGYREGALGYSSAALGSSCLCVCPVDTTAVVSSRTLRLHMQVSALLVTAAHINIADERGRTPLHIACELGDPVLVDRLLHGAFNVLSYTTCLAHHHSACMCFNQKPNLLKRSVRCIRLHSCRADVTGAWQGVHTAAVLLCCAAATHVQ